jgi:hypothetical protein
MTQDPRRLADDSAGSDLARALREARGDVLSPERVTRVSAALQAAGIGAASAAAAGLGAGARAPKSLVAKLLAAGPLRVGLAAIVVAVSVLGAASRWGRSRPVTTEDPERVPQAPPDTAPYHPGAPDLTPPPGEVSQPPPEAPPADAPPADAPQATAVVAPRPRGSAHPQHPSSVPSPREGALLLEARSLVDTNPARALALVHAHEQEFPASQLQAERARIAAEARRRLQR